MESSSPARRPGQTEKRKRKAIIVIPTVFKISISDNSATAVAGFSSAVCFFELQSNITGQSRPAKQKERSSRVEKIPIRISLSKETTP
jgi:hypothetical protein